MEAFVYFWIGRCIAFARGIYCQSLLKDFRTYANWPYEKHQLFTKGRYNEELLAETVSISVFGSVSVSVSVSVPVSVSVSVSIFVSISISVSVYY